MQRCPHHRLRGLESRPALRAVAFQKQYLAFRNSISLSETPEFVANRWARCLHPALESSNMAESPRSRVVHTPPLQGRRRWVRFPPRTPNREPPLIARAGATLSVSLCIVVLRSLLFMEFYKRSCIVSRGFRSFCVPESVLPLSASYLLVSLFAACVAACTSSSGHLSPLCLVSISTSSIRT